MCDSGAMATLGRRISTRRISTVAVATGLLLAAGCGGNDSAGTTTSPSASGSASPTASISGSTTASPSASASASGKGWTPPTIVAPPSSAKAVASSDARASGVVRVQVNNCQGLAQASGSFVDDDLVLTAASIFNGASSIAVHSDNGVVRGQLVGLDATRGVALVKLLPTGDGSRLTGHVFSLAAADPAVGAKVTMLAHPLMRALYQDTGVVKEVSGGTIVHTANAAPGTSGGALLDQSGKLVGVEVATNGDGTGDHHAVAVSTLKTLVAGWKKSGTAQKLATCQADGPSMTSIHPDAPAIRQALGRYTRGISAPTTVDTATGLTGQAEAWQTLGETQQKKYGSPAKFIASFKGATVGAANVDNLEVRDHFTDTLIWTIQLEGPGKACQVHKQRVVLSSAPGHWVVDQLTDVESPSSC